MKRREKERDSQTDMCKEKRKIETASETDRRRKESERKGWKR